MRRISVILLFLMGCNPVKQVLRDPDKLQIVAEEIIRRGGCVNDTIKIESVKDSIVVKDSIIERISSIPCKDFDTSIGRARIRVSSGVLTYSAKDSIVYRTKTITNNIRDTKLESILKRDIATRDSIAKTYQEIIRNSQIANRELAWDKGMWIVKFWVLLTVSLAIIFRKQLARMLFKIWV